MKSIENAMFDKDCCIEVLERLNKYKRLQDLVENFITDELHVNLQSIKVIKGTYKNHDVFVVEAFDKTRCRHQPIAMVTDFGFYMATEAEVKHNENYDRNWVDNLERKLKPEMVNLYRNRSNEWILYLENYFSKLQMLTHVKELAIREYNAIVDKQTENPLLPLPVLTKEEFSSILNGGNKPKAKNKR